MNVAELENKIINADCLDILRQLPDKCVDLLLTDPPYGIKADRGVGRGIKKNDNIIKKNWDNGVPEDVVFEEMFRVSKEQIIWGELLLLALEKALPGVHCVG
jgi:site-specific DNA-methyltransferase (adenine-specific)